MTEKIEHMALIVFLAIMVVGSISTAAIKAYKETPVKMDHLAQWYDQKYGH
ncbi:hypothetical protein [Paenibacillus terrae]|uniref:hypothetical protein n=1 Tax=Paenibacillus terrae TaxID=159743 RepID=UPI000AB08297|nr:hypothetical protein [Paenibacillus terrae]